MKEKIETINLKPKTINTLRDLAIKLEKEDIETAYELMSLAHKYRPNGFLIKSKLNEYREIKNLTNKKNQLKLKELVESGEVAIIPIGFRCHTKANIRKRLGITQKSLIFDAGFFPPSSIVSILKEQKINLSYEDKQSHTVCIKHEKYNDEKVGFGIKFQKSTYEEINSLAVNKMIKGINKYLDDTFGYYTLDLKHNYLLAHYNWHDFASFAKSKGITDPKINIPQINETFNRRIERMFKMCHKAKHVFFVHFEKQKYQYMMIDDVKYDLDDYSEVEETVKDIFGGKAHVIDLKQYNAQNILEIIE